MDPNEQRVEIARFKPFYAGLIVAMLLIVFTPFTASVVCLVKHGVAMPASTTLAVLLATAVVTAVIHEGLHYLAALFLQVPGVKIRFSIRLVGILVDYDYMTPSQYPLVALAPQVITPLLVLVARETSELAQLLYCIAAAVNLAGGAPDIVNALYFTLVHHNARRFKLLYNERSDIAGGVVEYDDRIVVYML